MPLCVEVAARSSLLSRAQVAEVLEELRLYHPDVIFSPHWLETKGDKDQTISLRELGKTDLFTREIEAFQLAGNCRISIHSAKDLPDPLQKRLKMIALTKGVDSSDVLVLKDHETISTLPFGAKIGTSSPRREESIYALRSDLRCIDIRGTIEKRLGLVDTGKLDGVVMAEAALIRLKLTHRTRVWLKGETPCFQGQLAILAHEDDDEMEKLFRCLDSRIDLFRN